MSAADNDRDQAADDPCFNLDRTIRHPDHQVPMLTWWAGIYDHVYVAPHPFFRVAELGGLDSESFPDDHLIKSVGQAVTWDEVHRAVAPERSKQDVYLAIWLLSVLGVATRADVELQQRIEAYCRRQRLYLPEEAGHAAIMEPAIGRFLAGFGHATVTAWDEFRDNAVEIPLSDFEQGRPVIRLPKSTTGSCIWGLHLADPGVLLTWEFESTEITIAMTDRALGLVRPEEFFAGWYADKRTYSDVNNPIDFLPRQA